MIVKSYKIQYFEDFCSFIIWTAAVVVFSVSLEFQNLLWNDDVMNL